NQGRTDNSWGPRAIGDHGAPVSSLKPHPKKPMKGTRGISWGPLLTPGPQAVPSARMVSPPLVVTVYNWSSASICQSGPSKSANLILPSPHTDNSAAMQNCNKCPYFILSLL
ncbi:unnamed protein product, partial [Staurois parvus]